MRQVGQGEALVAWVSWALVGVATLVTYARVDPRELYHVSGSGLTGGASRVLVFLDYPVALAAIALALVALSALHVRAWLVGAPAIALCAVVAWPGVVDQANLDARPVNAVPAAGVVLAAALGAVAVARAGPGLAERLPGDPVRLVVAVVVVVVSLPWIAAELGVHLPGDVFLGEELRREPDGTLLAAVHLGRHHGFDGALLVVTALLASRPLVAGRLGTALAAYLGALLAYGAVNATQDAWLEQVVKRGWSDAAIPSATVPRAHWIWAVVVALAVVCGLLLLLERRARAAGRHAILPA